MAIHIPFGTLVSFGLSPNVISFPNPSSPVQDFTIEWLSGFTPLAFAKYPFDNFGVSAAPVKEPEATWVYVVLGGAATPYQDVENAVATILQGFDAVYTDASSNQSSLLVVKDAAGVSRSCQARIKKVVVSLTAAKNTMYYMMPITWTILSDFV